MLLAFKTLSLLVILPETVISADDSKVKVLLIPTNEELMIARDTLELVK